MSSYEQPPTDPDPTIVGWKPPQSPAGAVPPTPKRPWWKRKWGIAAIVVGVLFALGAIGSAMDPQTTGSTPSPSSNLGITDPVTSPSATPEPTPVTTPDPAVSIEPTPEPTPDPTPEPTPAPTPVASVLKTSGRGDKVVKMSAQEAPTFAKITGKGSGNFAVVSYIGSEYSDLLVNEIGSYSGTVYIQPGVDRLKVTSNGSWTIDVRPITSAKQWDGTTALAGKGDGVFILTDSAFGTTTIKNKGQSNFAVIAYSIDGVYLDLLVNEIGSYSGEVQLPDEDPIVMSVHSPGGTWSWSPVEQ
jgi:hypothetical protein